MTTLSSLKSIAELAQAGLLPDVPGPLLEKVAETYAVSLTPTVAGMIDRDDPSDPIARQFVPSVAELETRPEERADPIGDDAFSPVEGVVHRYPDRVLLKLLHVCPVYCRFCFRRASVGPGGEAYLSPAALDRAFAYLASTPAIWEVILTGGDPLTLTLRRVQNILKRLAAINHIRVLRIHTRVPCVDPEIVSPELVEALRNCGKTVYVVLHANHPRELTQHARAACARFIDSGIPMLSQSVLLRGVNDTVDTLRDLFRSFVECRIKPYYLHQLDYAPGTSHFRVPLSEGQALIHGLQGHISGLCLPRYMLDIPGGHGKVPIETSYLDRGADLLEKSEHDGYVQLTDHVQVTDRHGKIHNYPPQGESAKDDSAKNDSGKDHPPMAREDYSPKR